MSHTENHATEGVNPETTASAAREEAAGAAGVSRGLTPTDPGYKRALIGALFAGLASFNAMYVTQAMLPSITADFGISPTVAALSVSATTGALALSVIPVGILSERLGRYRILQISVMAATFLSLLVAIAPGVGSLLLMRALQGVAVAGVPAVIMTYLAEEIDAKHLPRVMGFYISGTSIGGLFGRLIPGAVLEFADWRVAVLTSGGVSVLIGLAMLVLLPPSRNFTPKKITVSHELAAFAGHFRSPVLLGLFVLPFLLMGAFVSLYNYLGFHLIGEYGLPESLAAAVFVIYLSGTWSSARAGRAVQSYGQGRVLTVSMVLALAGLLLMFIPTIWLTVTGALLFTAAFFACHSVASGWVSAAAKKDRAEASSTYVLSYYLGSSLLGALSGQFFDIGWEALLAWLTGLYVLALLITLFVHRKAKQQA